MRTITYTSPYVPAEWIAAHGLRPSLVVPGPSAASAPWAYGEGVCPYARAFAGEVARLPEGGGAIFTTACDQMRRVAELAAGTAHVPVFLMNLPSTWQTAAAHALYAAELQRLGRFLVGLGGKPPSPAELAAVMRRHDDARAALRAARGRLSPRRHAEAMAAFQRTGVLDLPDPPPAESSAGRGIPVALLGGPLPLEDYRLFDRVEACGGWVALNATEGGERTLPAPFDRQRLQADPFLELAQAYFGAIPDVFQRPNHPLFAWLKRELRQSGARGIIIRHYLWCDLWRAEVPRLVEWAGLPALHLDAEGGDLPWERTDARLQAFMETLCRRYAATDGQEEMASPAARQGTA